jgi:hypothetical protein
MQYDKDHCAGIGSLGYDVYVERDGRRIRVGTYASYRVARWEAVEAGGSVHGPTW